MKLRKLELHGFKSFAHKTEIFFEDGITGIVGPNGCGKSNVVDAIKWVLGEQSAKRLRGAQMEDVIFGGTTELSPLNFARVALSFDNGAGELEGQPPLVTIERRLDRSGQSEYAINGAGCRLRDIRELFKGTGAGMRGYSVIEQGQVEVLLTANAMERRVIFEEAAGIGKFKEKKKAALAKLERVDANLTRVADVCDEVDRQIRRIKTQATKARNYQEYAARLKELRVQMALCHFGVAKGDLAAHQQVLHEVKAHEARMRADIDGKQQQLGALDAQITEFDQTLERLHKTILDLQCQADEAVTRIDVARTTIRHEEKNGLRLRHMVEDLECRGGELEREIREFEAQRDDTQARFDQALAHHQAVEDERQALDAAIDELQRRLNEHRAEIEAHQRQLQHGERERAKSEGEFDGASRRLDAVRRRLEALAEEAQELARLGEECAAHRAEQEELLAGWTETHAAKTQRHLGERQTVNRLSQEIEKRRQHRDRIESRLITLRDMLSRGEGLGDGVEALLKAAREGEYEGVGPLVAQTLSVHQDAVLAVEHLLGDRARHVWVEDETTAWRAIEALADNEQGAAILEVLERSAQAAAPTLPKAPRGAGVRGPLADFVTVEPRYRATIERWLSGAVLVEDRQVAQALLDRHADGPFAFVTIAGECYAAHGSWLGGSFGHAQGVVQQRHEIEKLERELAEETRALTTIEEEKAKRLAVLELLERELSELRDRIYRGELTVLEARKEGEHLEKRGQALVAQKGDLETESAQLNAVLHKDQRQSQDWEARRNALATAEKEARQRVDEALQAMKEAQKRRQDVELQVTEARVEAARLNHMIQAFEKDLASTGLSLTSTRALLKATRGELSGSTREIEEAEALIRDRDLFIREAGPRREAADRQFAELSAKRQAMREHQETLLSTLRGLQNEYRTVADGVSDVEIKAHDAQARMKQIASRIWEDYEIDLADRLVDQGAPSIDEAQVSADIEELGAKLKRLGSVNMEAIGELDELEGRSTHLGRQRDDLKRAQKQLMDIVRKIEATSRKMFLETFEAIRENFKGLFRKLFGGGRADILLENPEDVLESGIDIIARPPGKEPRSITLLSGGEKALTAVSLLLAIFQANPSPFAILDEVDAPLDESNIGRFRDLLVEFARATQFLIITHAKPTMSAARVLYGITQEQQGVSKKIAMTFESSGHGASGDEAGSAERESA